MAALPDNDRAAVRGILADRYSAVHTVIPLSTADLRALVNFVDTRMDAEESAMVAALPTGDGKDWLLANPSIGRDIIVEVERKRAEVL